MSLRRLLQHEVTVLRPPTPETVDDRGNPTGNLVADPASVPAFVQAADVKEGLGAEAFASVHGTDTVIADFSVFLEPTVSIDERCRIQWGSEQLEVVGVRAEQGRGQRHHLHVLARSV